MKKEILLMSLALLLAMSLVATSCPGPVVEEQVVEEAVVEEPVVEEPAPPETAESEVTVTPDKSTKRHEEPDPYIVQRGNLVASYKYSGGVLVGAEVFTGVVNRGGPGFVEVVFIGREQRENRTVWTDSEIIYLESGEAKTVTGFIPASVIRPPGHTTGRRVEVTATASRVPDIDSLIRDLDHDDVNVRRNAVILLGEVREIRAVKPLVQALLQDEDISVRGEAAEALGKIGDARAVEPLIQALNDEESDVRGEAAEALGKIGDARAVQPLVQALQDENSDVRGKAARALGEIGDARAVESLIQVLERWIE